ncbi:elongation factor (EF-TS), putative [Plasmodium knowlesi strain H]|uniref:Elongation factor Ts, mitochondrial n=3 Tax=Plasmodium knowlesi TaxID=5850 RepID=A0A5K1VP85_PLAKH|nr:elongation factor (EF-TS), putative [Plasmodium knowlesi strain H]OTN65787.1 Elongation factor Ts - mitochondrial [Plasmodium knowlesi]CAA9988019.1 elongation factor (EF-TS), putative [Plasmodium knowlesi strain H]SBO22017.1 elongation factor (EF-TS), putative [Plasmodium knowlesi strain H]SBO29475.1 elongation factor (EF-TS), putative [Plasmodium knowlesi strain H]VVS77493.1 elongation factor (EF-TS), putative [Plasmodium knowlesi strain H]|eukprot:XP_002258998.1 elongation factor (ef-ts), putative [Plasmodium knowlesi strain H]
MKIHTLFKFILVICSALLPQNRCYRSSQKFQLVSTFNKFVKKRKWNFRPHVSANPPNEHLQNLKYVREVTNASIQTCNDALKECNGDVEKAIELVRRSAKNTSFVSTSVKVKTEGLVGSQMGKDRVIMLEVLSDSDFVARNEKFVRFLRTLLSASLAEGSQSSIQAADNETKNERNNVVLTCEGATSPGATELLSLPYEDHTGDSTTTVGEQINYLRNIFREDIRIGRFAKYERKNENQFLHYYIHNQVEENIGTSGVLLVLTVDQLPEKLKSKGECISEIANDIALHILSAKPVSVSISDLPEQVVQREMAIIRESLQVLKKPENILNNMINGKMRKFYNSVVLLEQEYMLDDTKRKVSQVIRDFCKKHDMNISVSHFDTFVIGEKNILRE